MGIPFTEQLTQALAIPVASRAPASQTFDNTNAATVGPIDMSLYRRVMALVNVGVISTNGNLQAFFQASAESNANFANLASGAPSLTMTTSNREGTLEVRSDQIGSGNRYLQLCLLLSVANAFTAATVLADAGRYAPVGGTGGNDANTVTRSVASI